MKSKTTAILLCFFLGFLGIHRFYMGYTLIGIIQLLTGGGFLIWMVVDFVRLITGSLGPDGSDWVENERRKKEEKERIEILKLTIWFNLFIGIYNLYVFNEMNSIFHLILGSANVGVWVFFREKYLNFSFAKLFVTNK